MPIASHRYLEVSVADYTLPDLPYDYGALEPHISGEIMELHHSKHHATYVKGANTALEQMAEASAGGTIGDAVGARDPLRGLAEMIFGLSSLSGILLDELAGVTGRSRGEVLHAVHRRYLDPGVGPPR
jgi:iron/manganese superoxide dismutase-like protein